MAEEEQRTEEAEGLVEDEPREGEPWAKTSSGDADSITNDDSL
jgi:hypothetical protein